MKPPAAFILNFSCFRLLLYGRYDVSDIRTQDVPSVLLSVIVCTRAYYFQLYASHRPISFGRCFFVFIGTDRVFVGSVFLLRSVYAHYNCAQPVESNVSGEIIRSNNVLIKIVARVRLKMSQRDRQIFSIILSQKQYQCLMIYVTIIIIVFVVLCDCAVPQSIIRLT